MKDQDLNMGINKQDLPRKKWRWILLTLLGVLVMFGTPVGCRLWNHYDVTRLKPRPKYQQHVDIELASLDVSQIPFIAEFKITNRSSKEGVRVELLSLDALTSSGKFVDSLGARWRFETQINTTVIINPGSNPLNHPFTPMVKAGETLTYAFQLIPNHVSLEPVGPDLFKSPEPQQLNYLLDLEVSINPENLPGTMWEPVISQGVVKIYW